jgi:hypothetical protein
LGKITENIIRGFPQSFVERVTCIREVFLICKHTFHVILDRGIQGFLLGRAYSRHCDLTSGSEKLSVVICFIWVLQVEFIFCCWLMWLINQSKMARAVKSRFLEL